MNLRRTETSLVGLEPILCGRTAAARVKGHSRQLKHRNSCVLALEWKGRDEAPAITGIIIPAKQCTVDGSFNALNLYMPWCVDSYAGNNLFGAT